MFNLAISSNALPDSPLDSHVKTEVILNCAKIDDDEKCRRVLTSAALSLQVFPEEFGEEFGSLQNAYAKNKSNHLVEPFLKQATEAYIDSKGLVLFKSLLQKKMFEKWPSDFVKFIADGFDIKIDNSPFVEVAIKAGKIYWRIMQGENIKFVRHVGWNEIIENTHKVRMTWEQFRRFKDAGKRNGTVAITKERFRECIARRYGWHLIDNADRTWEELKAKVILNHRDRLSHSWRITSGKDIRLSYGSLSYDQVAAAFKDILSNKNSGESFDTYYPGAVAYRPERTPKIWASTGRVTHENPKSEENAAKKWDVGTYDELNKHAMEGDELDHDHIPSTAAQRANQKALLKKINEYLVYLDGKININTGYPLRNRWSYDAEAQKWGAENENWVRYQSEIVGESKEDWWCIEIPKTLHTRGLTYAEKPKAQATLVSHPLLDEINCYLVILKLELSSDEYLQALGAFRYLYHCQAKVPVSAISSRYDRSCVAWDFFNNAEKKDSLDQLFYNQLVSCLQVA